MRPTTPCTPGTRRWRTPCPDFHLLGRLAEYKYYNMDAIVVRALELADRLLG